MEGNVLLQAMAQLWKGVYCSRKWHSYGRECTVPGSGTVNEGSELLQAVAVTEGRVLLQAVAQLWKRSVLLQAVAQLWKGVYCYRQ